MRRALTGGCETPLLQLDDGVFRVPATVVFGSLQGRARMAGRRERMAKASVHCSSRGRYETHRSQ